MKSESSLLLSLWEQVVDYIPEGKRVAIATGLIREMEEHGATSKDLHDATDEDKYIAQAYEIVFDELEDDYEEEDYKEL